MGLIIIYSIVFSFIALVLIFPPERISAEIEFDANHRSVKWLTQSSYCNFPILLAILLFM